jgi:hypothetical protein
MENLDEQDKKNENWAGSYIFAGCMFIGMGVGAASANTGIGTMIGMGVGFLVSTMYKSEKSK